MAQINPHYNPEKLGLTMLSFEEPDMSYEFNILCFWSTGDGRVYTASDSGCSCPTPFEDNYSGENQTEVLQKLERVGSTVHAAATFDNWNKAISSDRGRLPQSDKDRAVEWVKAELAKTPPPLSYTPGGRVVLPALGDFGWEPPKK